MSLKTGKRFIVLRLTPEMENKLVYLCTKVKFGHHKRYQEWFQRQVCCFCMIIYPPNKSSQIIYFHFVVSLSSKDFDKAHVC